MKLIARPEDTGGQMPTKEYGQYSLVSYVHHLRGERVNVGVVVWHPRFGWRFPRSGNLERIKCIDRDADVERVGRDLVAIQAILSEWRRPDASPLAALASQFRCHNLTVSEPLNARITDIDFSSDRLFASLIAPDPAPADPPADTPEPPP